MSDNEQKYFIVTGVSSGIGEATAIALLQQGHHVIGIARRENKQLLTYPHYHSQQIDLADLKSLPAAMKTLVKNYPTIHGVVCNAGRGQFGSVEEFSYQQINDLVDINFTSQVYLVRAFVPLMKRQSGGDIIFLGSEAALNGGRKGALYSATKFALRGFAQALRDEVSKNGLRVTIINPGMVKTPFFDELDFTPGDEASQHILPEDVASAISFVLNARQGIVFDEINLSPLKKVIQFGKKPKA